MTRPTRALASMLSALLLAAPAASAGPDGSGSRVPEVVEVSAERFAFTPSQIKVRKGALLEIRLTSADTDHGFRIVGTSTDVRIPKRNRGVATVKFEAAEVGRYTFECSHVCGAGHASMRGSIVVTE